MNELKAEVSCLVESYHPLSNFQTRANSHTQNSLAEENLSTLRTYLCNTEQLCSNSNSPHHSLWVPMAIVLISLTDEREHLDPSRSMDTSQI